MSGHSKWSSIKHKKGAADAKRGQLFTKLARAIQVAARDGGGDPAGNAALATAMQKARDARMPKDNIERAIAKGTGADGSGAAIETAVYEGYGPGGVAIMVEALTDNRNRTSAELRHTFTRNGGSLGEPGSVAWNFEKKGRDPGGREPPLRGRPRSGDRRRRGGRGDRRRRVRGDHRACRPAGGPRGARGGRRGASTSPRSRCVPAAACPSRAAR